MNAPRHLTEEDRQTVADGTLDPQRSEEIAAHLGVCASCAADVARLEKLMRRLHDAPVASAPSSAPLDEMWSDIRARIEQTKIVPLAPLGLAGAVTDRTAAVRRRSLWLSASLAAAAVIFIIFERMPRGAQPDDSAPASNGIPMSVVAESSRVYEQEANTLLNDLELQRSLLRPQTAEAIDHDLRIIDQAIAELKDAIAHDPNNRSLRQLLASSYRQKVELLKRAGITG
ncbi:MAG: hypothetical protein ABJF01_02395 [bacterium]